MPRWIIHSGDAYYPGVESYDNEGEARYAWEKLKNRRKLDDDSRYVDTDYLAIIVESNRVGGE
jgi:hypothetical protein